MHLQSPPKLKKIKPILTFFFFLFSFPFFLSSCDTFDPPLVVPAYGHIDSIHFSVPADSASKQGTASSNIQYAWVYLDDNPVGAFQLPCTFPMIAANGTHIIKVFAGITPVGTTSPAAMYPFYQFYSITMNLQQGNKYKIEPTSVYYPWTQFLYKENFDEYTPGSYPTGIINYHGGGNASVASRTTMVVVEGKLAYQGFSGMVIVNHPNTYYMGITWPSDSLPNSSTPVYMELNYRCTAQFSIGMFDLDTTNYSNPIAIVYPAPTWSKMYVSLNSTINAFQYIYQNIYFAMPLDTADGHTSDTLLLDNIKILD